MFELSDEDAIKLCDFLGRHSHNDIKRIYHADQLAKADFNDAYYALAYALGTVEDELRICREGMETWNKIYHSLTAYLADKRLPSYLMPESIFTIMVNGTSHSLSQSHITYEQLVELAFPGSQTVYSVTYHGGPPVNHSGILAPGESVYIHYSMIFNVADTSNA
jgi:hypothetical protein